MPADDADPFDLQRFVDAQDPVYEQVRAELAAGSKRSHWMWFVFPQIAGLGSSPGRSATRLHRAPRPRPIWRTRCSARGCANARGSYAARRAAASTTSSARPTT